MTITRSVGLNHGYSAVKDEGVARTARVTLNFAGAGVAATDDAANDCTLITIPGGSDPTGVVTPEGFGAAAGSANNTTAIQAAIDFGRSNGVPVYFPRDYSHSGTLTLGTNDVLFGLNSRTTITYTGTGTAWALASPAVRAYTVRVSDLRIETSTGAVGMDLGFLTGSSFERVVINGFSTAGWRGAAVSGECVYNRFIDCSWVSCGDAVKLGPGGANSNLILGCTFISNTTGVKILDSNQNMVVNSQLESCTTGVRIQASSNALSDGNFVSGNRLEACTDTIVVENSFIRDTVVLYNLETAGGTFTDAGCRTHIGDTFAGTTHRLMQFANGSFPDTTTDPARVPMMVWSSTEDVPLWSNGDDWIYANGAIQGSGGRQVHVSAAPTTGTWVRGDIAWNSSPSASGTIGWVCTTGGTPGTWKTWGAISA